MMKTNQWNRISANQPNQHGSARIREVTMANGEINNNGFGGGFLADMLRDMKDLYGIEDNTKDSQKSKITFILRSLAEYSILKTQGEFLKMPSSFSERINELMSEYNYTKKELAEMTGYHYSTIVQYCAGTRLPSGPRTEALAEIFDCDVDYLMGRSDVRRVRDLEKAVYQNISRKDIELLNALKKADPNVRSAIMILLGLKAAR